MTHKEQLYRDALDFLTDLCADLEVTDPWYGRAQTLLLEMMEEETRDTCQGKYDLS
jgi:hypothetical protein